MNWPSWPSISLSLSLGFTDDDVGMRFNSCVSSPVVKQQQLECCLSSNVVGLEHSGLDCFESLQIANSSKNTIDKR